MVKEMNLIYIESKTLLENKPAVEWLDGCGALSGASRKISEMLRDMVHRYNTAVSFDVEQRELYHATTEYYIEEGFTHTPTALEFCQGVAKIMGIPEPTFGEPEEPNFMGNPSNMMSKEDIDKVIESIASQPSYPHKTYRILESLDNVPLDKRIPLSEWIPPFGKPVLYIDGNSFSYTVFTEINEKGLYCIWSTQLGRVIANPDGYWMRIL